MPRSLLSRKPDPGRTVAAGRWISRRHNGPHGSRHYDVYLPAGRNRRAAVPLVLMLHGCQQRAVEFAESSGMVAAADAHGFLVAAPRQDPRHQMHGCWRWYETAHQRRGAGEPAILRDIVAELAGPNAEWTVDAQRVYVLGLSAGGSMALILATTYPDVFAAAGVHSATAYASASQGMAALRTMAARGRDSLGAGAGSRIPPVVVIQGAADRVVRAPNADRIVEQWLASLRDDAPGRNRIRPLASTRSLRINGRHCTRTRWYSATGRRVLEYWRVDTLGHAWSGGRMTGPYVDREGPPAAETMWAFLARHRLARRAAAGEPAQLPVLALDDLGRPLPIW